MYAVDTNGAESAANVPDVATLIAFTDGTVAAGTPIRGAHVGQLRQAIDAMRALTNLTATWTSYSAPTGPVLASHFTEMRDQLNEARVRLELPEIAFSVPVTVGGPIHSSHVTTLRGGVQ